MASSYLGPESPRPLSVISEGYQNRYRIPAHPAWEQYTFGNQYERTLEGLVNKYLELGTTDRMCYIGDTKGSMAESLAERFCLLEPLLSVIPGHYSYVETDSKKILSIRVAHVGSEEYFRLQAKEKPEMRTLFDKIVIKDALRYFENPVEMYCNIMKCLKKDGKMLIIHRPSSINTLPVFRNAKQRLEDNEIPYTDIIKDLKSLDFDVQWDIECLNLTISKKKWFSMLKAKFPPQMEILSDFEMMAGIRELADGIMKYEGDLVEFQDRLLFIVVCNPAQKRRGYPGIKRYNADDMVPFPNLKDLNYSMELTPELKQMVKSRSRAAHTDSQSGIVFG
ncbi:uncharacterized protein LOC127858683 [Dreissena polymorpha]|uniref:Uncharacterized protein n=1 Tax=Dreissena polymorpha TaxID=45954 RepID=A0A9D4BY34_DREPO|nr:uncharacterized protein LOC127858683 [Dreissena polymorpha]XP_052251867.1 uncharacterized protein LOC127858683 [Dreissena polymorpha]XP_052251869.1 uncharacterized protein LOC127858683 [Dreissena polymorpha]XP_052251870.1 uncharacterized protein LOC127858683 [Dreissena polymorpha]KAH3713074.1 hypothetical protein DPMN_072841 [Dreissena polymorpha]